jgi:PAS domain S-box-containing protein
MSAVNQEVLRGGGASGALMRSLDWAKTPVGPVSEWPQSLRTAMSILLETSFGMAIAWGPEHIFFYNDAYRPILGSTKHPAAMGRRIAEIFPEIWHIIGPMFGEVYREGTTFGWDNWRLPLDRHGFAEECFFTFSYSPIRDESGGVGGVLVTVSEITDRVLGERRMRILRDLGARTAEARSEEEACRIAAAALQNERWDLPFTMIYLGEALVAHSGAAPSHADWPREGITSVQIPYSDDFGATMIRQAIALPIGSRGLLVAGISPRLRFDTEYRGFLHLVANQIATAAASAHAYAEEKARAESLAELDRAKTTFFSNVSHEFRTPLTLLLGPLDDVLQRDTIMEADREALVIAQRNALRLLKLVNTLLEFSRIEAGRIDASYEPVDLSALTVDLAGVFRAAIEKAGLSFDVRCEPLQQPVYVDRDMWEKIVFNLLSNAFKFTFEGRIAVTLRAAGSEVELRVSDTGAGIPAAELPNMFKRFHRVRGTRARSNEGTGIGLALVQELVRLHAGRVAIESRENEGTAFSIFIPFGNEHLPAERISTARMRATAAIGPEPFLHEFDQWTRGTPQPAAPTTAARILVVDDNADMRDYLSRLLSPFWQVETAADGAEALHRVTSSKFHLVLADVMMPVMDGFELLQQIRKNESIRDLPIILLSARAGEEAKAEGLYAGADDYLTKPFSSTELIARVRSLLALAEARKEANERIRSILDSITDGFTFVDRNWIIQMVNPKAEEISGRSAEELIGWNLWERFPEAVGSQLHAAHIKAMEERTPQRAEAYYEPLGKWIEVNVYPSGDGVSCFFRDVSERVVTARNLEIANRAKDEFLTTLSHELRTPMTATLGWATLLRVGQFQEQEWRQATEAIEQSTRAQARLIDEILDVSRISTGKLQLEMAPVSLEEIVEVAVSTIQQLARSKGLYVETHIEKLRGGVVGDADRLGQIVRNLLSNAVKFTPRGGRIIVRLDQPDDGTARIQVNDTGNGIASDFLPFVFERFRQADSGFTRKHGGLGIGLSIVKDLTELHGGSVSAASDGPGKGARFTITLPLAGGDALSAPLPARDEAGVTLDGIAVLIVDDDEPTRSMLRAALARFGANVVVAHSVPDALTILANNSRAVVVSDIAMPEEDGFALISRLRASGEVRNPVIALTANARGEDRERAMAAGFDAFIAKPVDLDVLAAEIKRLGTR